MSTKKIALLGILTAISLVLLPLVRFPIVPVSFLEYDLADIPIILGTILCGPVAGIILTFIASIFQGILFSAGSGFIGVLMHITATGSLVLVLGNIYNRKKTVKNLVVAAVLGVITWVVVMIIYNLIFTPIFMGVDIDAVIALLIPAIIPFNIIKASLNTAMAVSLFYILKTRFKIEKKLGL